MNILATIPCLINLSIGNSSYAVGCVGTLGPGPTPLSAKPTPGSQREKAKAPAGP